MIIYIGFQEITLLGHELKSSNVNYLLTVVKHFEVKKHPEVTQLLLKKYLQKSQQYFKKWRIHTDTNIVGL